MTFLTAAMRMPARIRCRPSPSRGTAAVAGAAADLVGAGILLGAAPSPSDTGLWIAAALLHAAAALGVSLWFADRGSRRWLAIAAVLALPVAGLVVAATALGTRGRSAAIRRDTPRPAREGSIGGEAVRRLADLLAPYDALACGDEERRHAALCALARRTDPDAVLVLRRAAGGADPDLALSAALALDGIVASGEQDAPAREAEGEIRDAAV